MHLFCLHQDLCCCAWRKPKKSRQYSSLPFQAFRCDTLASRSCARFQPMSSKANTADELWKHLCGSQIFFFVREQHLNLQDNACAEATQLCVHTLQGPTAAGSAYSKHSSRLPETHWDRKTVAANQETC